jgi:hypothetical protein
MVRAMAAIDTLNERAVATSSKPCATSIAPQQFTYEGNPQHSGTARLQSISPYMRNYISVKFSSHFTFIPSRVIGMHSALKERFTHASAMPADRHQTSGDCQSQRPP